ncbi:capping protein, Arp2/3 and myosin-I linker protein 3 [Silurus asotus]|uniref:Capping protein, Arp2/3 and myosin-I linker protein 3 n=1 Tax=Silurus asotus TaxID=30991 RepID=A0AAD5A2V4_SILAS|nr:capping protein, Arp2/3 and myosin-I linker protein 3 [Silurus asotus]
MSAGVANGISGVAAHDSIRKFVDKSAVKFARGVKLETKNGKSEDRILVITTWRLYLMASKVPTKVVIETEKSTYSLRLQSREHRDHVINHINYALSRIFNNSVFAPSLCHSDSDLSDGSRKYSPSSDTSVETQRACGGFSETYAALCDYNGISCKEEVQWDVDTIYHSQDNREFNLLDFSHLESRDLAVIVASMAYNTWFTKLYCKDMRIGSEVTEQVLHTLSKSSSLEELTMENVGLKSDFPQKMSVALSENPASVIHSLNLAHNTLDNQGVCNLIQQVCRLSKGLRLLNLSKTSLSSKGVVSLSQALCSNDDYSNSLLHLDLSKNPGVLSGEDAMHLHMFLSQPNCLVHLDLSGTDCCVDSSIFQLFGALLRGCCADLSYLNLSKNSFAHRNLFLGLTNNPHINDMHLDISSCELRSAGAAVLQELFPRVTSIATLDVSDNGYPIIPQSTWASMLTLCFTLGFDGDLLTVFSGLSRHPSLRHLHLGKNFNIKSRYGRVLDEILHKLVLQSLSLVDSRLRSRGTVLVNALGSNACLRKVDLSGNGLEDIGAKMLSKALQINTTLRNFTLQYMPIPLSDVTQAYRSAPEKTEQALTKIQRALLRNNQTQRFSQRQALRLHQGLVTSTAEQVMERLCVRVQQQVCVLRGVSDAEELQAAKQVLKEARNSRALYPSLCELAHVLSVDGPVRQRLDSLAGELAKAADKELQVIVDSMVSLCRELCPLSSGAAERLSPPLSSVSERVSIPRSAIRTALMERAAQDIHRVLEEVKLSVVSYLTNSIVDQILQELYSTHKALTLQVSQMKQWDGLCDGGTGRRSHRHRDSLEITDEELGTSIDTIAIKKRSARTRRIRPVSTRLSLCDDSSSSPPNSGAQLSSPLSRSASWEGLSALPTQGAPLHHVTRISEMEPDHDPRSGLTDREIDRQTLKPGDRQASWETDRQKQLDRELEWQSLRKSESETDGQTLRHVNRVLERQASRQMDKTSEREADRQTIRKSEKELDRATPRQIDKPGERETDRHTLRQNDRELDRQTLWKAERELDRQALRQIDRELDRQSLWRADRHSERELDRHTLRQIDRQAEAQQKQWLETRKGADRKWAESKQQPDTQWTDLRQVDRQSERQWMDRQIDRHTHRIPSPIAERDFCPDADKQIHCEDSHSDSGSWEQSMDRSPPSDPQMEHQIEPCSSDERCKGVGTRGTSVGRLVLCPSKPEPPPQSSKPSLAKLRQRPLQESSGEECVRPQAPVKPQRSRKALSCDTGTDRDSPNNLERPPIPRNPPVKKPRAPQNRNLSLDQPAMQSTIPRP